MNFVILDITIPRWSGKRKISFGADRVRIIEQEVGKLLRSGYITKVQFTEWLSNMVVVPKSTGKWRMCIDFIDLNMACWKDPYPLSKIDLLVDLTLGYASLSIMDAYQGYH